MLRTTIAAASLAVIGAAANAAPIDFTIDVANSYVTITDQSGGGILCGLTNCGVSASLAAGFGGSFSLDELATKSFDFITFAGNGTTGFSDRDFTIEAKLAFNPPTAEVTDSGSGGAFLLAGFITAGNLTWDTVPTQLALADGSLITVDFEGGAGLLIDGNADYTTSASVTVDSIAPVPLPAGALLLVGGLGTLATLRRRKAA